MTKEERIQKAYAKVHNSQYRDCKIYAEAAKEFDVIIFRTVSDDLVHYYSKYIHEECPMHDTLYFIGEEILNIHQYDDQEVLTEVVERLLPQRVEPIHFMERGPSGVYEFDCIHVTGNAFAKFDVLEDGQLYCKGLIVPYEEFDHNSPLANFMGAFFDRDSLAMANILSKYIPGKNG